MGSAAGLRVVATSPLRLMSRALPGHLRVLSADAFVWHGALTGGDRGARSLFGGLQTQLAHALGAEQAASLSQAEHSSHPP